MDRPGALELVDGNVDVLMSMIELAVKTVRSLSRRAE
jgi:hypothetical protein